MINLSGSGLRLGIRQRCVELMQTDVLSSGYSHQSFVTTQTLDLVHNAVANAGVCFVTPNLTLWEEFSNSNYDSFAERYRGLNSRFLLERRKSCEEQYAEYNKSKWLTQIWQSASSTSAGSSVSYVVGRKKTEAAHSKTTASRNLIRIVLATLLDLPPRTLVYRQ